MKKDFKRYQALQKHYETLLPFDFERLDEIEFAIYDTYKDKEERDKVTKLFKKVLKHIEKAQKLILEESKQFL